MHNLLEVVVDDLDKGSSLDIHLDDILKMVNVVVAIVLPDEIVEIHQEFRGSYCSHELGGDGIDKIDELTAERLEVRRGDGDASQVLQTIDKERIHCDRNTVRVAWSTALVMLVEDMALKVHDVLVGQVASVKGLDLVLHDVAVLLDVVLLVKFLAKRDNVLSRNIGIGVELGARSSIRCSDVILDEVSLLSQVETRIELFDVGDGHLLVDGHQTFLNLSSNFTACDLVINVEVFRNRNDYGLWTFLAGRFIGLTNTIH